MPKLRKKKIKPQKATNRYNVLTVFIFDGLNLGIITGIFVRAHIPCAYFLRGTSYI